MLPPHHYEIQFNSQRAFGRSPRTSKLIAKLHLFSRVLAMTMIMMMVSPLNSSAQTSPLIIGHRGARGFFPENTIEGFINTVKMGVTALELDVVISKDSQVVVSHEPWFNHKICTDPEGKDVKRSRQRNLYRMDYAEIKKYDCDKLGHPGFPEQQKTPASKPLLQDVIREGEKYCRENHHPPVLWFIEIKSRKISDNKFHPVPKKFAKLVYDAIKPFHIDERVIIKSFDMREIKELHRIDPALKLGLLVIRSKNVKRKIKELGFTPFAFNPNYKFLSKKTVSEIHQLGMRTYPWTVNSEKEIARLESYGVDGIITDYPLKPQ